MKSKKVELSHVELILRNLKDQLKRKKIKYNELAKGIGLSESGLKKILSGGDVSVRRLSQLCQYAGVSLTEIVDDRQNSTVDFTEAQQAEFLKNLNLFNVYWLFVYERLSIEQVQEHLKISKIEVFKLTRKLDDLRLIKLLPNDRVRVPSIRAVDWTGKGKFVSKLYQEWSNQLLQDITRFHDNSDQIFLIRYLPMTEKTYHEFKLALQTLEKEFVRRSIFEMQTQHNNIHHVRWITGADQKSFVTGRLKK